jgi:hypothetical protein
VYDLRPLEAIHHHQVTAARQPPPPIEVQTKPDAAAVKTAPNVKGTWPALAQSQPEKCDDSYDARHTLALAAAKLMTTQQPRASNYMPHQHSPRPLPSPGPVAEATLHSDPASVPETPAASQTAAELIIRHRTQPTATTGPSAVAEAEAPTSLPPPSTHLLMVQDLAQTKHQGRLQHPPVPPTSPPDASPRPAGRRSRLPSRLMPPGSSPVSPFALVQTYKHPSGGVSDSEPTASVQVPHPPASPRGGPGGWSEDTQWVRPPSSPSPAAAAARGRAPPVPGAPTLFTGDRLTANTAGVISEVVAGVVAAPRPPTRGSWVDSRAADQQPPSHVAAAHDQLPSPGAQPKVDATVDEPLTGPEQETALATTLRHSQGSGVGVGNRGGGGGAHGSHRWWTRVTSLALKIALSSQLEQVCAVRGVGGGWAQIIGAAMAQVEG